VRSASQNIERPKIEEEIKLDFADVLFKPSASSMSSRSEVDLTRTFTFLNSKKTWTGVPVVSSNMDTTGTFEIAAVLSKHKCLTAMHKFYSF